MNLSCRVHWSFEEKDQLQSVALTEYAALLVWRDDENTVSCRNAVCFNKNEKVEMLQLMCHLKYIFVPRYFRS